MGNTPGSAITVYGIIFSNSSSAIASYLLDSDPSTSGNIYSPNSPGSTASYPVLNSQLLQWTWGAPASSDECHTIQLTVHEPNIFYLDYITVQSSTAFLPSPRPFNASGNVPNVNVGCADATDHEKNDTGAIVGGVVGGVVGCVLFCLLFLQYIRKQRQGCQGARVPRHRSKWLILTFLLSRMRVKLINL